jgi:hypothetical protein
MRLIDADALRQKLLEELHNRSMQGFGKGLMIANSCVVNAPTIEPRKNGKWLPDNNSVYEMRFVCSECKESQVVPTIGFTKYKPIWDFCPYCGARMEEK